MAVALSVQQKNLELQTVRQANGELEKEKESITLKREPSLLMGALKRLLKRYPALISLIAGLLGAFAQTLIGTPFDFMKARMQTSGSGKSALALGLAILRREGLLAFWTGASGALSSCATENIILFFGSAWLKRTMFRGRQDLTLAQTFASGSLVGVMTAVAICPSEVVKVRTQVRQTTSMAAVRELLLKPSGFFSGLPVMWSFDIPYNSFALATEEAYLGLCRWMGCARKSDLQQFIAGGLAGLVAWALMLPVDKLKTMVQSGEGTLRQVLLAAVAGYRKTGVAWFYPGLFIVLVRAFAANAALFYVARKTERALEAVAAEKEDCSLSLASTSCGSASEFS
jgi:hypothetical protein